MALDDILLPLRVQRLGCLGEELGPRQAELSLRDSGLVSCSWAHSEGGTVLLNHVVR